MLLAAGAAVDQAANSGATPLYIACRFGHSEVASLLIAHGAAVNQTDSQGHSPLLVACLYGQLACVQLLSSHGVSRNLPHGRSAEQTAERNGHDEVVTWLITSRLWSTPLHHLDIIDTNRARALLRAGADIHASTAPEGPTAPTPLSLARSLHAEGNASDGTAAYLLLRAAKPWSEQTHELFPVAARERAVALMMLGHRLSREERFSGQEVGFFDAWMRHVMSHAICRV